MDGVKFIVKTKDLRRAAFAVGFGLTVGKAVGDLVSAGINGMTTGLIQGMAKHGNKVTQKACERSGVDYVDENIGNDPRQ